MLKSADDAPLESIMWWYVRLEGFRILLKFPARALMIKDWLLIDGISQNINDVHVKNTHFKRYAFRNIRLEEQQSMVKNHTISMFGL